MISRLLLAAFGGMVITIGLLLFMDDVTNRYLLRDPTQYFRITDYFPAPGRGRQLPDVPVVPESAPERPRFDVPQEGGPLDGEFAPWEEPEENAAPTLEEQFLLDERQAAGPGGWSRWVT